MLRALVRTLSGMENDRRDVVGQPLPAYAHPEFSYTDAPEAWVDFIADTGDGFNATYTMARLLAEPRLDVGGQTTQRGKLLVLGGDLVYAPPSREAYRDRLLGPFRAAFPVEDSLTAPDAFALPGEQDWRDGLGGFRSTFAQRGWLGGWRLRQSRSYFAIALPHRYWLWGVDTGLRVDIEPQRQYFRDAAAKLARGDRVIVCTHPALWRGADPTDAPQLEFIDGLLEERGAERILHLSGERHVYARYAAEGEARQCFIAGGGGAFTHDTAGLPGRIARRGASEPLQLRSCYPSATVCKQLATRVLLPMKGLQVGVVGGGVWSLAFLVGELPLERYADGMLPFPHMWVGAWLTLLTQPGLALMLGVGTMLLVAFARGRSPTVRAALGAVHAVAHVSLALVVCGVALRLLHDSEPSAWLGFELGLVLRWPVAFIAGFSSTELVFSLYLLATRYGLGQHAEELFSALRSEDYKCFIRLHVTPEAVLRVYPIGVERVPRRWTLASGAAPDAPWFARADEATPQPLAGLAQLLEPPVDIPPNAAQRAALDAPIETNRDPPVDVFISYARPDARWVRAFIDALEGAARAAGMPDLRVFVDTESIGLAEHWRSRILDEIARCHSFVAVLSPAFVASWNAKRMCFVEYDTARRRELDDPELVLDVLSEPTQLPPSLGAVNAANLAGIAPEAIAASAPFVALFEVLLPRIHARRIRGSDRAAAPRTGRRSIPPRVSPSVDTPPSRVKG